MDKIIIKQNKKQKSLKEELNINNNNNTSNMKRLFRTKTTSFSERLANPTGMTEKEICKAKKNS